MVMRNVTQPIEITAELKAWGALALARQAAKNQKTAPTTFATQACKPRTRSGSLTIPL